MSKLEDSLVEPSSVESGEFRQALRNWASGVCIVSAVTDSGAMGLTISSFSSVSLEPAIIALCIDSKSKSGKAIVEQGAFSLNILSNSQKELSNRFATNGNEMERFSGLDYQLSPHPAFRESLSVLQCIKYDAIEIGDHWVIFAKVLSTESCENTEGNSKEPLLYFDGGYRVIAESP